MQQSGADQAVYTVEEAARKMKISRNYLYLLITNGEGPPVKRLGNRIRIPVIAFTAWINKPSKRKG